MSTIQSSIDHMTPGVRRRAVMAVLIAGALLGLASGGASRGAQPSAAGQTTAGASRSGRPLSGRARRGLVRGTIRFTRDARMFSRDVREGMDLYMVRHRAQGSPTLGAGVQSRRSPAPPPLIEAPGATTVTDERVKDDR